MIGVLDTFLCKPAISTVCVYKVGKLNLNFDIKNKVITLFFKIGLLGHKFENLFKKLHGVTITPHKSVPITSIILLFGRAIDSENHKKVCQKHSLKRIIRKMMGPIGYS